MLLTEMLLLLLLLLLFMGDGHRLQEFLQALCQAEPVVLVPRQPQLPGGPAPPEPVSVLPAQEVPQDGHEKRRWVACLPSKAPGCLERSWAWGLRWVLCSSNQITQNKQTNNTSPETTNTHTHTPTHTLASSSSFAFCSLSFGSTLYPVPHSLARWLQSMNSMCKIITK